MRLIEKLKFLILFIILFIAGYNAINDTVNFKKEVRNMKEQILISHGFIKEEIKLLLDY